MGGHVGIIRRDEPVAARLDGVNPKLYDMKRKHRTGKNLKHCLLVAAALPALLIPQQGAAQSAPAPAKAPDVTFVFWNVRNYRLEPVKDRDGKVTTPAKEPLAAEAVASTLASLRPDIVGLCEIGTRKDLADLQSRLEKLGVDLRYCTWVDGPDRERHLALLSRFPLEQIRHDTKSAFKIGELPYRVQRGFLDCAVKVCPEFFLQLVGAHFKSRRVVPEFDNAMFRRQESLVLREKIEGILRAAPETMLIVFGDLNDTKNSPAVSGLAGRRGGKESLEILELADQMGDQWTYLWPESDEYSRVDYVMASDALLPLVRKSESMIHRAPNWLDASDHRPLVVKIGLPAETKKK